VRVGVARETPPGERRAAVVPETRQKLVKAGLDTVVAPGFGVAAAQSQHAVRELRDDLVRKGVAVKFAIHPVAGHTPGHMNVLLAEADVPYDELLEIDCINPEFVQIDAVLVIGANDVVNPSAKTDRTNPIYGMPVLEVEKARTVMVVECSLSPGFAGIDNPFYYLPNTLMVSGDARKISLELVQATNSQ
jgi:NAD(P) transhydrogenase subunit beta